MRNFIKKCKSRISDDSGAAVTVENLLWIVLSVLIVLLVGGIIYKAVKKKSEQTAECIEKSNDLIISGTSKC